MPTLPARLRALAAVWLAFKIISGAAPAVHADLPAFARALLAEPATRATPATPAAPAPLQRFEFHEPHMGTDTRVVLYAPARDERAAGEAARAAFDRVEALNGVLSDYQPTSELMQLSARAGRGADVSASGDVAVGAANEIAGVANGSASAAAVAHAAAAGGRAIAVSADLFRVLAASWDLAVRSDGAFDVTCGALTRLWRRARHLSELPSAARVEEARALTGYRAMQLDPRARTVTLATPGMTLDVGGIAKGYAAEEALNVLAARGMRRALVAIGGDIAVGDPPPEHDGWLVEIATVDTAAAGAAAHPGPGAIALRNAAISTAGDAEQWLTVNGVRYSHILDPRTGWPMTIRSSTTVIAQHGLDADGLDTTAALLGPDRGIALVEATPGAAVYMARIEADGHVTVRTSTRWPPRARVNQTAREDVTQTDAPPTNAPLSNAPRHDVTRQHAMRKDAVPNAATPQDETPSARPR